MKKTKQIKFWMIILTMSIWGSSSIMSETNFGMKAGLTTSKFTGESTLENADSMGATMGIFGKQSIMNGVSIIGELNLTQRGGTQHQEVDGSKYSATYNLNYVELPILLSVNVTNRLGVYAGGYAAKLLDAGLKFPGYPSNDVTDMFNFNKDDYGTIIGISYDIDSSFSFDLRLTQGQESLTPDFKMSNQSFSFSANKSF